MTEQCSEHDAQAMPASNALYGRTDGRTNEEQLSPTMDQETSVTRTPAYGNFSSGGNGMTDREALLEALVAERFTHLPETPTRHASPESAFVEARITAVHDWLVGPTRRKRAGEEARASEEAVSQVIAS